MPDFISIITVILICILILVIAQISTKALGKKMRGSAKGKYMEIIDEVPVGNDRYIFIVKIGEKAYLCGSANGNISFLTELDELPEEGTVSGGAPGSSGSDFWELFKENWKKNTGFGKDRRK